jgi:hypothetical protein
MRIHENLKDTYPWYPEKLKISIEIEIIEISVSLRILKIGHGYG